MAHPQRVKGIAKKFKDTYYRNDDTVRARDNGHEYVQPAPPCVILFAAVQANAFFCGVKSVTIPPPVHHYFEMRKATSCRRTSAKNIGTHIKTHS